METLMHVDEHTSLADEAVAEPTSVGEAEEPHPTPGAVLGPTPLEADGSAAGLYGRTSPLRDKLTMYRPSKAAKAFWKRYRAGITTPEERGAAGPEMTG